MRQEFPPIDREPLSDAVLQINRERIEDMVMLGEDKIWLALEPKDEATRFPSYKPSGTRQSLQRELLEKLDATQTSFGDVRVGDQALAENVVYEAMLNNTPYYLRAWQKALTNQKGSRQEVMCLVAYRTLEALIEDLGQDQ